MTLEELRALPLLEGLDDGRLQDLLDVAIEVVAAPGQVLWSAGEPADGWWVLLDGAVDLVRLTGRDEIAIGAMRSPGMWAGGLRAWDETGVYLVTGRVAEDTRMLRLDAALLRELLQRWFALGVHLMDGLSRTIRSVEATARQRESLVALGTLAAGLAHEINNPAAAATRAVDSLTETVEQLAASVATLSSTLTDGERLVRLAMLRDELDTAPVARDPIAAADAEDELADWLEGNGVGDGWRLAPALTAAGADPAWCERVLAEAGRDGLAAALTWMTGALAARAMLGELSESTRRISDLVGAVKSYSQMDRSARQRVDVREGLESSLTVLGHKLHPGLEVVRDYAPGTSIDGYPGELNQVWTNLLDNAIDVMPGIGTLRVSTSAEGEAVVVEIADTGGGMPPEVVARAFEAFYTTKDVGKGTGLGLDIARRIIEERHGGEIFLDSSPDGTTVRVRLPLRAG
ncbi:ATP-binding protein [Nocardioides silvaticus]|uniref:histidine kinase n=1 Tax=Nocardioides silvaticus TaxID=2201891 RepID=A0A316TJ45_9ACTN|nr:ATP-binding protein [Nocardioides silvaticus]